MRSHLLLFLTVLLAPGVLHAQQSPGPVQNGEAAVRSTIEAVFAAGERKDLTALDTLYAGEDLTVIEGAGINRSWADYRDHHLAPELEEFRSFRYRPGDIEAHVQGDIAWSIFRYELEAETAERKADIVGRGTAVLERRGGRWVVRHIHTSGRPRRPTDR